MTNPDERRAGAAAPYWCDDVYDDAIRLGLKVREVVYSGHSRFQEIQIVDTVTFGRVLVLDGVFQTSEKDEHFYHEMLVQPAMVVADDIRRVLIIGGGDGGAAREVLRHAGVEKLTMVEIDGDVVEACQQHLPSIGTAWDDPRLDLQIADGVGFLQRAASGSFDVVVLDGPDPIGPAEGLYAADFYESVARVLAPDGVFALHAESPVIVRHLFLKVLRLLRATFARVHPYFGSVPLYGTGPWAWALAGRTVDPDAVHQARAAAVEADTRYFNRAMHGAAFALPNDLRGELG